MDSQFNRETTAVSEKSCLQTVQARKAKAVRRSRFHSDSIRLACQRPGRRSVVIETVEINVHRTNRHATRGSPHDSFAVQFYIEVDVRALTPNNQFDLVSA